MLPFDFEDVIRAGLEAEQRPEDGLLHCSGDLIGSLRHAQLRIAGAPTVENPLLSAIRLNTGTMWHHWLEQSIHRMYGEDRKVFTEMKVNDGLPEGWGGTADYVIWSDEYQGYVLADLKTIKGEGITWIIRDGAKKEHIWQASAYWHALVYMGYPMVNGFAIMYLPMNDVPREDVQIRVEECAVLDKDKVWNQMIGRKQQLDWYLDSNPAENGWHNDYLAPPLEREQKLVKNKKTGGYDLVLKPHYLTMYCPFPDDVCDCNQQGQTKIGEFVPHDGGWIYGARAGFEETSYEVAPAGTVLDF